MKTVLASIALVLAATAVSAADLKADFKAVCDSPAVKSEKLKEACAADAAPDELKDGTRFKAVGIGAEVNTLLANLKFFTVAAK